MDKYKTSELGKALKKVFHAQMSVVESVKSAQREIAAIFADRQNNPPMPKVDTGKLGQIVGQCPLCQRNVIRGKFNYGCSGYRDGCKFRVGLSICQRVISKRNVQQLLETGRTSKIKNFISKKSGKSFDAYLRLEDGNAVFDFSP
jgi:hypothetical protein